MCSLLSYTIHFFTKGHMLTPGRTCCNDLLREKYTRDFVNG